jgi:chromosome partitioning protein
MGTIVTIATSKGGGGKTTLATCLAANLSAHGYRVAVIDADRNQTFKDWFDHNYEGRPMTVTSEVRHVEVVDHAQAQADAHDVTIIDTAGFENLTAATAMSTADFVLIPCMPDRGSVIEAAKTARQVGGLGRAARRDIPFAVMLMRWNPKELADRAASQDLLAASVPIMRQHIPSLTHFKQMTFSGQVQTTGHIGIFFDRVIAELVERSAIPAKSKLLA